MIQIDFLSYQGFLQVKKDQEQRYIFDPIRKAWLVLQPEELVRQLVLQYLFQDKGYKKSHIRSESGLQINHLQKRCDLLIYDREVQPYLLIECKAPQVKINEDTFWQIANYNSQLKAKFLVVTNGIQTYCCEMDYVGLDHQFLDSIPPYPSQSED